MRDTPRRTVKGCSEIRLPGPNSPVKISSLRRRTVRPVCDSASTAWFKVPTLSASLNGMTPNCIIHTVVYAVCRISATLGSKTPVSSGDPQIQKDRPHLRASSRAHFRARPRSGISPVTLNGMPIEGWKIMRPSNRRVNLSCLLAYQISKQHAKITLTSL